MKADLLVVGAGLYGLTVAERAANDLGLTTQVPIRSVYLTSGRSRTMSLGKQIVELRCL